MVAEKLEWIDSAGGPLVAMPKAVRAEWMGVESDDYADACAVTGLLGVVSRRWGDVLVLGDEPASTAVLQRKNQPTLVRWIFAPDEARLREAALSDALDERSPDETVTLRGSGGLMVLFDSGADGATASALEFTLPTGDLTVRACFIKDEPREVCFVVVGFDS